MPHDFTTCKLGETSELLPLETSDEHRRAVQQMVQQCRRGIQIISRDLDPAVYDFPEFAEALTRALLEGRRMKVRVLVHDAQSIARHGHRLLDVAARLSSFIEIRKPGPDHKDYNGGMFIADVRGYVTRRTADRYTGAANFNGPREAALLLDEFEEMWQKSTPDANLRKFRI
jgi:hypothetical protein